MCLLMLSSDQSQGCAFFSQGSAFFSQDGALLGRALLLNCIATGWFATSRGRILGRALLLIVLLQAGLRLSTAARPDWSAGYCRIGLRGEAGKNLFLRAELLSSAKGFASPLSSRLSVPVPVWGLSSQCLLSPAKRPPILLESREDRREI